MYLLPHCAQQINTKNSNTYSDIYSLVQKESELKTNTVVQSLQANISDTVSVNI